MCCVLQTLQTFEMIVYEWIVLLFSVAVSQHTHTHTLHDGGLHTGSSGSESE